ncbi:MAG: hypothetical protein LBS01_10050 [Prevotellaceae bacterium]|jgi:hypothetical protein|nr:hypothetical protein [Prevotellaceae bacterium]
MVKKILTATIVILSFVGANAQGVGIMTETPSPLTVLDVKNTVTAGGDTVPRGILIPRMREAQRNAINVSDMDDARGLWIFNIDEDCFNYYSKSDSEWQSVCGQMGKAQFTIDCASIEVRGKYGDGVALDNSNYLRVTLNVSRPGSYTISATSSPDNGYFFETTGNFYSPGPITLNISGTGQPVKHSQGAKLLDTSDDTPDNFTLNSSGGGADCTFKITVMSTSIQSKFSIDCRATVVEGAYFEDEPLSSATSPINGQSNRIKVTLKNVPTSSFGAVAVLQTNSVDGISFNGEAVLNASTVEVYLQGTGVPRGLNDKIMTITSNSESDQSSCTATVGMLIPRKRLLTVGMESLYGYNPGDIARPTNSMNAMLTDKNNFGYNQWSILKFSGFNNHTVNNQPPNNWVDAPNTWPDDNRDIIALRTAAWQNMYGKTLKALLEGTKENPKIDIVMIGYDTEYFRDNNTEDLAKAKALVDFVKTGGILMICAEVETSNRNFIRLLFNNNSIDSKLGAGAGSLYTFGFNSDNTPAGMKPYYCKDNDPILAGPFEDIVGRTWGEDASITRYVTNLPLDEVVIYSGARPIGAPINDVNDANGVTIFRHKEYPFVFIGDGGFNSNEVRGFTGLTVCPFTLGIKTINGKKYNNYPMGRTSYGNTTGRAYNAVFTANAFAWCISQAEAYRRAQRK